MVAHLFASAHEMDPRVDSGSTVAGSDVNELTALVRRVVAKRVGDPHLVDDIVQETLARVLSARGRLGDRALGPYAIVTARNLVASMWRTSATGKRHQHQLFDPSHPADPDQPLVEQEETDAVRAALERLAPDEREVLVAHEVEGVDTVSLAREAGATPGAIAARLNRTRAKLRVEYLVELAGQSPTARCRPVLLSLSAGDRRRQDQLDAGYHLLECDYCAINSEPLFDRRRDAGAEEVRLPVRADPDIVNARQRGRELAVKVGFSAAEATLVATAISEVARNIVRFADHGQITVSISSDTDLGELTVIARDIGPGIDDIDRALEPGYTTYGGRGLGLPGCKRMMDEFELMSEKGRGTTVTMRKWRRT